jgi:hypothetical protein
MGWGRMKTSIRRRGALAAVAVLAAVAGLAGCQGDGGGTKDAGAPVSPRAKAPAKPPAPGEALEAAYRKASTGAKSAHVAATITQPVPAGSGTPASTVTVKVAGDLGWEPTAMDFSMTIDAGTGKSVTMDERLVGGAVYMNMSRLLGTRETGGKPWVRYDLSEPGALTGGTAGADEITGALNKAQDPSQIVGLLLKSPNVKDVGREKAGGVPAEHYAGTLTLDDMARNSTALSGLSPAASKQLAQQLSQQGMTSEHIDLWVGEDGRPLRGLNSMTTAVGVLKSDMRYSDYSQKPAKVQAPPAGLTADLAEVLKKEQEQGAVADQGASAGQGG